MATRAQFGHTWWGREWLQALAQIDFDNRLPRGRAYANRGAVRDIAVDGGTVVAHVAGSRPQPYAVRIEVPPFVAAKARKLVERLRADPALIARLLNRELDPAVLQHASAEGLQVFPARWSDLHMSCSCPDWAVPCKHLAAVVYLLSQEIDGNPFLVFTLRGVDLPRLLRSGDTPAAAVADVQPPDAASVLFGATDDGASPQGADAAALDDLDFTTLPDLREPLWRLLAAEPVFFRAGDFRALAQRVMARVADAARLRLEAPASDDAPLPEGHARLLADAQGALDVAGVTCAGQALTALPALADALARLAPARRADLTPELSVLHAAWQIALHLLARGAVVPQVMMQDAHTTRLRWRPAELDAGVRTMVERLAAALPAGLVARRHGRRRVPLPAPVQARLLLGTLLGDAVQRVRAAATEKPAGDPVLALFFGSLQARFDGPGEGALAGSIHGWLARLQHVPGALLPVLELAEPDDAADGFALTLAVADAAAPHQAPVPLARVMTHPSWATRRLPVLQAVAMLAQFHPPLVEHVRQGARQPLRLGFDALPDFLFETLPALRLLGIRALLPRALERLLRPRAALKVKARAASGTGRLDADAVFSFQWQVSIGEQALSAAEFEKLLGKAQGVVRFRGQYVYLDAAEMDRLRRQLARAQALSGNELMRAALAGEYDGAPVALDAAAQRLLETLRRDAEVAPPLGLAATLRPYQQRGYAWLWRNARLGLGSVIADDMGLGKTLQVLALLLRLRQDGELEGAAALVVVPTTLLTNWQKEAERFAPALRVQVHHGSRRGLKTAEPRPHLVLTTYGTLRGDAAALAARPWRIVVVDEAQNIKNPAAAQSRAVKGIPARSFVAMSGTPVENRLLEYWSIVDFVQRGYLGGATHFEREFATPIQSHRDAAAAERLRRALAPFMLRRLKSDRSIIADLPDKLEQDQYCTLAREQAALYESVVREGLASVAGQSDTFRRQGLVLQMILALKQVCNHPAHYLKQDRADVAASGKTLRLVDLLDAIVQAEGKALVFTQFREMGVLLQRLLAERLGREPMFLHGGVARARRDTLVERFQQERAERVFLLSLKAGGTGLNLTAANHVVHFDLWWNPAVEAQATDRAYRIGQQRNVQVHRFITRGTFEERINAMMHAKRELAALTVGSGETWIGQLPVDELRGLFELGSARGRAA